MSNTDKLREIAEKHHGMTFLNISGCVSDLTALISEGYVEKSKYAELLRQRDELREALIDMVWQFAYEGTKNGEGVMYAGGLSALEGAFSALGLSDPITVEDFEAAIKNTDG